METRVKNKLGLKQKHSRSVGSRLFSIMKNIHSKASSQTTSKFTYKPAEMPRTLQATRTETILYAQRQFLFR